MIQPLLGSSCVLLCGLAPLTAQEERKLVLPEKPLFVLHIDGPGKIARELGGTKLGGMLRGQEAAAWSAKLQDALDLGLEPRLEALGLDYEALKRGIFSFEGRITLAGGLSLEEVLEKGFENTRPEDLRPWLLLVADPGEGDLSEAVAELCALLQDDEALGGRIEEEEIGGYRLLLVEEEGMGLALPFLVGGKACCLFGSHLGERLEALLGEGKGPVLEPGPEGRSFELLLDLKRLADFLAGMGRRADLRDLGLEEGEGLFQGLVSALGVTSLGDLVLSVKGAGDFLVLDLQLEMGLEPGLLKAFLPRGRRARRLLDFVPLHREEWSIEWLDISLLYTKLGEVVDAFSSLIPYDRDDFEGMFEDFFRVRLKEDLLDHLEGGLLHLPPRDPVKGLEETWKRADFEGTGMGGGSCFGFTLKDAGSFARSFDTLLRSRVQHVTRKKEKYKDFTIYHFKLLGMFKAYYCVTDEVFLLASGEEGAMGLRAVLDEVALRRAGKPRAGFPPGLAERMEHAPKGWGTLSLTDLGKQCEILGLFLEMMRAEVGDVFSGGKGVFEEVGSGLEKLRGLLRKYDLEKLCLVAAYRGGRLTLRWIW